MELSQTQHSVKHKTRAYYSKKKVYTNLLMNGNYIKISLINWVNFTIQYFIILYILTETNDMKVS